jgi:hypothetical protein
MGLLFIPQIIYEYGEQWWNDFNTEKLSQRHFVHHKPYMD